MKIQRQNLIVIAGPNGAGKSTTAPSLLKGTLKVTEFVNADLIAQGLSGFQPEGAVFHAGIRNFFKLYRPLADTWFFYDNSGGGNPRLLAYGEKDNSLLVNDPFLWHTINEAYGNKGKT